MAGLRPFGQLCPGAAVPDPLWGVTREPEQWGRPPPPRQAAWASLGLQGLQGHWALTHVISLSRFMVRVQQSPLACAATLSSEPCPGGQGSSCQGRWWELPLAVGVSRLVGWDSSGPGPRACVREWVHTLPQHGMCGVWSQPGGHAGSCQASSGTRERGPSKQRQRAGAPWAQESRGQGHGAAPPSPTTRTLSEGRGRRHTRLPSRVSVASRGHSCR